jgi:hypothetical protein
MCQPSRVGLHSVKQNYLSRQAIELVTLYDDDMITSAYVFCLPPIDGIIKVETKKKNHLSLNFVGINFTL